MSSLLPGRRRRNRKPVCRQCRGNLPFQLGGYKSAYCESCRHERAVARRAATGRSLIERAKVTGTAVRDGRTFTVVTLPPKRRYKPK